MTATANGQQPRSKYTEAADIFHPREAARQAALAAVDLRDALAAVDLRDALARVRTDDTGRARLMSDVREFSDALLAFSVYVAPFEVRSP